MAASGFGQFSKKIDKLQSEFDGRQLRASLEKIGQETKADIAEAVAGDIGSDHAMRGWRRNKPFEVLGRYDIVSDHEIEMTPTRKGRGPMRVLEEGRTAYKAGDVRRKGTYTSKKTGLKTDRLRKVKRNVGATAPMNTWSDATELMERRVPIRIRDRIVLGPAVRIFGKG